MRSGPEIQAALAAFAARWRGYSGGERAEAQTFLNELFAAYGTDRVTVGARFEDFASSAGFMDLHWPGVSIIEMKAPHKQVSAGREQVKRYWEESADEQADIGAARWVLLCNFHEFEIWEPGRFPKTKRLGFSLDELPQSYEALLFLAAPTLQPSFLLHHRELTAAAAASVAQVYQSLIDRAAAPSDEITRFTLQTVWTLFAEDLGLLTGSPLQRTIDRLRKDPSRSSAAELGFLFRVLNQKGNHNRKDLLAGTRYVNGQLFAAPAEVELTAAELEQLAGAAEHDWSQVDPTIFGSLLEGVIGRERRWELGAHYTHEADILKIVSPSIVRPWQLRIDATTSPQQARDLLEELAAFVVLDPACGCGNFLYVAYRELRGLEHQLKQRIHDLAASTGQPVPPQPWPYYPLANVLGIDIEPVAVLIARVTLWMGHRQMIDRFGQAEDPLPLVNLAGITIADAVFSPWPDADVIIGNPPFLGDRLIRRVRGGEYVEQLKATFPVGVVDYSAYWFRRAQEHLRDGQRAGLVSTNTLRENKHRRASLEHIMQTGGVITDAVSSQKWPGEAKVHVSITNWIKNPAAPPSEIMLDGAPVEGITSQLRPGRPDDEPRRLPANRGRAFIGCQPTGSGFIVTEAVASQLHYAGEGEVVRRYLSTDDIADAPGAEPSRWIIDFGTRPLEEATQYPRSLAIIRRTVKPDRDRNTQRHFAQLWWQFAWPRPAMRRSVADLRRYISCTLTGKRLLLVWSEPAWCPSNSTGVLTFDDDYAMGILSSRTHDAWAWARSSSFKADLRYTPSTVFETFPWPSAPEPAQREAVAAASRALLALRGQLAEQDQLGLTALYNLVDEGGYLPLVAAHQRLDEAVVAAYGWPKAIAQDAKDIVARLVRLNASISGGRQSYAPF